MNNGGPAFPGKICVDHIDDQPIYQHPKGMSLRDWFAGMALAGLNANQTMGTQLTCEDTAETSYRLADAMIKEREQCAESKR